MTVNAGDIAFLGANADDPDVFAFLVRTTIAAGDGFILTDGGFITDTGVASTTFRSTEGFLQYTAPAGGVAAGSVIVIDPVGLTATRNGGGAGGTVAILPNSTPASATIALAVSGDQITAYTVTGGTHLTGAPTLIAFIDFGTGAYTGSGSTNASNIPTIAGGQVLDLANVDNSIVNTTDPSTLTLAQLSDPTLFLVSDDTRFDFTSLSSGGGAGVTVSIGDASVAEGDAGTTLLTFTVTRSDNTTAFEVDFTTMDGTATVADGDYDATSGTLVFTVDGDLTQEVTIVVNGDTTPEPNETLTVELSDLVDVTGTTTIADASGTGTIVNDDIVFTLIGTIQGAGHKAPSVGGPVTDFGNSGDTRFNVEGVVTAITTTGFWIQDEGDGDILTSDGIFVFTGVPSAPNFGTVPASITLGETVQLLNVQVSEFRPGGSGGGNNLTITQLIASTGTLVELGGFTDIAPVVIGVDRMIPTGQVSDPGFLTFDPTTDAIDFWESLEGMLVEIPQSVAVSPTFAFRAPDPADPSNLEGPPANEIWVRLPGNTDPSSLTPPGGLILGETDPNPERIQIDDLTNPVEFPDVKVGDVLSPVTGVVGYDFTNYEVLVATAPAIVTPTTNAPEESPIEADERQVTIATYNVLNLDPKLESTALGAVAGSTLFTRLGNSDDDIGDGRYAGIAFDIAVAMQAPTIIALQEVQDNDGAEISGVLAADVTLKTLTDLIQSTYGIEYTFFEVPPTTSNNTGGQPNANIRNAFLYRADEVAFIAGSLIDDAAFANNRRPLVGEFEKNGVAFTVINNHLNSKGGDNGIFGNVQPPVLTSEPERITLANIVNDYVDDLLAADADAKVVVLGDMNDFAYSAPLRALEGTGAEKVLTNLAELLPDNDRYTFNFQGNSQDLDHILVSDTLFDEAEVEVDILHINVDFTDQASDHDPILSLLDFTNFDESLTLTAGDDSIDGGAGDDTVLGLNGDDTLSGGTGDDVLNGGAGDDILIGGEGDETYVVDSTGDVVLEAEDEGLDLVVASLAWTLGANLEDLVIDGVRGFRGTGNTLDNAITGNAGGNALIGRDGDDTLSGLGGNDTLNGGNGDDELIGGEGDDRLLGGRGNDTYTGGAGADTFVFSARAGDDVITDFEVGVDKVSLLPFGFADFAAVMAVTVDTAEGARIDLPGATDDTILFSGVTKAQFGMADFLI
jgi:hypothetical protein